MIFSKTTEDVKEAVIKDVIKAVVPDNMMDDNTKIYRTKRAILMRFVL